MGRVERRVAGRLVLCVAACLLIAPLARAQATWEQVDDMTMHLSDAEVIARDCAHSGNNAAALVAEPTRVGGPDPGQWWFSPHRGLGFEGDKPDRTDAYWDMSTGSHGAGHYLLSLGGGHTDRSDGRGVDLHLVGAGGDRLIAELDLINGGSTNIEFVVSPGDIVSGDVRFHAVAVGTQNGVIGDVGNGWTGTATLSFNALWTLTDWMSTHLSNAEVLARDAEHSGQNAAGLVAESTRLGGGDPGQWWFSPVRGLGFDANRGGLRDHAKWNMSTSGRGPGQYRLDLGGAYCPRGDGRGIDAYLVGGGGDELIAELDGSGTLSVLFTVTADDIDGGNIRFHLAAAPSNNQNATIGDVGDNRPGSAALSTTAAPVPMTISLLLLAGGLAALFRRRR